MLALFDESIDMASAIPQGYAIEELAEEGIMFEGGSVPLEVAGHQRPLGRAAASSICCRATGNLAIFGFMIEDSARGEVRPGPRRGSPLIIYNLTQSDADRMQRATALLCERLPGRRREARSTR